MTAIGFVADALMTKDALPRHCHRPRKEPRNTHTHLFLSTRTPTTSSFVDDANKFGEEEQDECEIFGETFCGETCAILLDDEMDANNNDNSFYVIDDSLPKNTASTQQIKNKQLKLILLGIPVVAPLLAFSSYVQFARFFAFFIDLIDFDGKDFLGSILQDGGLYQIQIITPAINGIVVPSISILFATLISNTVTALRQRQLDVRTKINTEASELRVLSSMIDSFPPSFERNKCYAYLMQYTSRLIAESRPGVVLNSLEYTGSMESEMNGFLATLNSLSSMPPAPLVANDSSRNNIDDFCCENENLCARPSELLLSESYAAVMRLNAERSIRISALQSTFPLSQYLILVAIGSSICLAFLIETNQEIIIFLNALQLRILWTMLIGLMSTLSVLCYDLSDPFRGIFTIESALKQLYTIRDALRVSSKYEDTF